jgi:uncharacterized protein YukE
MPSADVINVNFGALSSAADQLNMRARALETTMDTLQQSLTPIKETWYASGSSAGQAAEQSETRLRTAIADITAVIAQFSAKTTEAHDLQRALEDKNTSFFS